MKRAIRFRLSFMMFLQYVVMGVTAPILSLYLRDHLGFSGSQAGVIFSMSAISAFASPFVGAFIADRVISAERLLAVCHFIGAALMTVLYFQSAFGPVLFIYLGYMLVFGPTVALTNAITFHHLPQGGNYFGGIRVWGTLGWIAIAWGFGFLWLRGGGTTEVASRLGDALKLSAVFSFALGVYCLSLPRSGVISEGPRTIIPLDSMRVLVRPSVLLISALSFLNFFATRYYYFGMGPFLRHIGFSDGNIMPAMSLGQMTEVAGMAVLGLLLVRLGFKRVLIIGLSADMLRFCVFAFGKTTPVLMLGILCHGLAFAFFVTAVYIYLDSHCEKSSRSGVHQLFVIITSGIGGFLGSVAAGATLDKVTSAAGSVNYTAFWLVPAVMACISLVGVLIFFPGREKVNADG